MSHFTCIKMSAVKRHTIKSACMDMEEMEPPDVVGNVNN